MTNLENLFREILSIAGEDIQRDSLQKTPERAAKAMIDMTSGYRTSLNEIVNGALFNASNDDMVIVKDIALYSLCEHHMLPFLGKCHIAYLPNKSILGLSKFARIVDLYAKRFQVQERLTHEIAEAIYQTTDAKGVAVIIEAQHLCMMMRGVEKQNSIMKTSCMMGAFRDKQSTRMEFLDLVSST